MSEYLHVERPFLDQLAALGWRVTDQGAGSIPSDPAASLRDSFREWLLPQVFRDAVREINPWLTDRQLEDLRSQILRQPNRTLLEANEDIQKLLFKSQVDRNEETNEADPVVRLIDFEHPERNIFHVINQFRADTPSCVKSFIIPDIVLFVNGIPLVVVEAKIGDANTANPMRAAFEQLLRYRNGREETRIAGLKEGEPVSHKSPAHRHLWGKGQLWVNQLRLRAFLPVEGHLAGKIPRLHATLGSRARTGDPHPGIAAAGDAARRAAELLGVHGHGRRQAG